MSSSRGLARTGSCGDDLLAAHAFPDVLSDLNNAAESMTTEEPEALLAAMKAMGDGWGHAPS